MTTAHGSMNQGQVTPEKPKVVETKPELSEEQVQEMEAIFKLYDEDNSGRYKRE